MPRINIDEVEAVAHLARLEFDQEEKAQFTHQLERILEYIDKLDQLDTSSVEPTSHVLPIANVMREDKVKPSFPREEMLKNAPCPIEGYYGVPKVID
jgi:aspartyl-tRNA(Asn)/glutamyl-tRNA(Gln) amidotransferase subunit C